MAPRSGPGHAAPLLAVVVSLAIAACMVGTKVEDFRPAWRAAGVSAALGTSTRNIHGELLVLEEDALLLLIHPEAGGGVVRVPFAAIRQAEFDQVGSAGLRNGRAPSPRARERLRLLSRFPQGLSPELMGRLLESHGQEEPKLVEPSASIVEPEASARAGTVPGSSPGVGAELERFLEAALRGTEPYRDPSGATAAGYRAVGADAPGMGRHWIHPRLLASGRVEAEKPAVLTYVTVAGRQVLTGVVYAVPPGRPLPAGPIPEAAWHYHSGPLDRESLTLDHSTGAAGVGLAVAHVWLWQENPAGLFEAENWSLPFIRLGLPPPDEPPVPAARALSLLAGGSDYYAEQFRLHGDLSAEDAAAVHEALQGAAFELGRWWAGRPPMLDAEALQWLAEAWEAMLAAVDASISPDAARRLRLPDHSAGLREHEGTRDLGS